MLWVVTLCACMCARFCYTDAGHVLTWGCGRNGKSGHGSSHENILAPTVVSMTPSVVSNSGPMASQLLQSMPPSGLMGLHTLWSV